MGSSAASVWNGRRWNRLGRRGRSRRKDAPSLFSDLRRVTLLVVSLLLLTFVLLNYVGQRVAVDGSSMVPALEDGDQLLVDKLSYQISDPERFDIVIFALKDDPDRYYIKRVIGLPGETVQITEGVIYIDGEALEEDYGLAVIADAKRAEEPITLGDDEYFVLGDNRNNSKDSRSDDVGNVSRSQIMGKAVFRIWPFSSFGSLS